MALRMCDHFRRSTPKVGMEMILNVPPIDTRESTVCLSQLRPHRSGKARIRGGAVGQSRAQSLCERRVPERKFRVKIDSFKSGHLNEDKNRLRVFMDGSKLENRESGFGVFFETPVSGEHTVRQRLGPHPTVFQAEAMAITRACEAVSAVMAEEGVFILDGYLAC